MKRLLLSLTILLLMCSTGFADQKMIRTGDAETFTPASVRNQNNFHLSKPAFNAIFFESFEDAFPPPGWLTVSEGDADEEWATTTSKSASGSRSAFIRYCSASETMDEWLVTPAIDLFDSPGAFLVFYEDHEYWENYGKHHYVKISTSSQSDIDSFQTLLDMTPAGHEIKGFKGQPVEIDLSNFIGQPTVYIAFQYTGTNADNWYLDDVAVLEPDDHDVRAVELQLNAYYEPGTTIQPKAVVRNVGLNEESFSVNFGHFDWDGNPVIIDTKTAENLAVGDMLQITFADYTFNPNYQAKYFVSTGLESDQDNSNDTITRDINSFTKEKEQILIEKGTGTWCGYCPGSALAVDELMQNFSNYIAVVEYHGGDPYETPLGRSRLLFYGITGYPTAIFNGTNWIVGGSSAMGSDWMDVYNLYLVAYIWGIVEKTGFSINVNVTDYGGYLTAVSKVKYEAASLLKSYRIFYALTESHIAESWRGLDSLQFVFRDMYPDANGKVLYEGAEAPTAGMVVTDSVQFTIPDSILQENCQLVAFLQDMNSKEIMAFEKVELEPRVPFSGIASSEDAAHPSVFMLSQNYPNPFNPQTWIQVRLPKAGNVDIAIYNVNGQLVRKLISAAFEPGQHKIRW
ncbi:choice-of-anchor J domain-containing protein, partial [candidate division KSB1 bacterium]|nr:choice-of-anchor J domain-containing protein [candidate division KSB1 bacterium]